MLQTAQSPSPVCVCAGLHILLWEPEGADQGSSKLVANGVRRKLWQARSLTGADGQF